MTSSERRSLPSILVRIRWTLAVVAILGSVVLAMVMRHVSQHEVNELLDQGLRESAEILQGTLAAMYREGSTPPQLTTHSDYEERLIWQIVSSHTGAVVHRSHKAPEAPIATPSGAAMHDSVDGLWRVVQLRMTSDGSWLLVGQSTREREEAQSEAVQYVTVAALLLGAGVTFLLSLLLRRELSPLRDFSREVAAFDPLNPTSARAMTTRAELLPLAEALTTLGARLAQRIRSEQAFTAHAAHAMRTPLAGIDVQLAMAAREAPAPLKERIATARQAATRLHQAMSALLTMFRSCEPPRQQSVNLADMILPLAPAGLSVDVPESSMVIVDPDLLSAVLLNLMDNAMRHGASRLSVQAGQEGSTWFIDLIDDGEGCTQEQLMAQRNRLEPGHHDPIRGGNGLGLTLADIVMRAHGGRVRLPDVAKGFHIRLEWPINTTTSAPPPSPRPRHTAAG